MTVAVAPRAALPVFRQARSLLDRVRALPAPEAREAVQGVIVALEALAPHLRESDASRYLDHWARELLNGHSTTAAVHLDRAVLALGLRPSEVRRAASSDHTLVSLNHTPPPSARPELSEPTPVEAVALPEPVVQREPAVVAEPRRVATEQALADRDPRFARLSPEEQELVAMLPLESDPLQGAGALAACWAGRMSPTSARGRYSRLANKLKEQHGRDLLLRGRGRYARLTA